MDCDAIILAAGLSSRMGEWKAGLKLGEKTVIEMAVDAALPLCHRVILVGGHKIERLTALFNGYGAVIVVNNPHFDRGMLSSVQRGVSEVASGNFFIALGDMPFVSPETYTALWQASFRKTDTEEVLIPIYKGKTGHPILLSQSHIPIITQAANRDFSLRDLLRSCPKKFIEVNDEGILLDLDTPEQYNQYIGLWNE